MKTITIITLLLVSAIPTFSSADIKRGEEIHNANCISCHNQGVYTREDRRMKSLHALRGQVARCDANLDLELFPEDIDAVTEYLNSNYYHFK